MKFLINVWQSDRLRINRDLLTDHFKMNIVLKLNRIILLKSGKEDFIKKESSYLDRVWTALSSSCTFMGELYDHLSGDV